MADEDIEARLAKLERTCAALLTHSQWAQEVLQKSGPLVAQLTKAVNARTPSAELFDQVATLTQRSVQHDKLLSENYRACSTLSWQMQEMRMHYALLTNPSPPKPGETCMRLHHVNGTTLEIERKVRIVEGEGIPYAE